MARRGGLGQTVHSGSMDAGLGGLGVERRAGRSTSCSVPTLPSGQVSGAWVRSPKVLGSALAENHSLGLSRRGVRWLEKVQASMHAPTSLCGKDPSGS